MDFAWYPAPSVEAQQVARLALATGGVSSSVTKRRETGFSGFTNIPPAAAKSAIARISPAEVKNTSKAKRLAEASTTRNATSNATNTKNNIRKHNPHGTIPDCASRTL